MSLPSNAIYLDANGKQVGHEFINCGWFCNANTIGRVLKGLGGFTPMPVDAHSVVVYGITFSVETVNQYKAGQINSDFVVAAIHDANSAA